MKRLLLSLFAALALPTAANAQKFNPDAHEICLKANDYIGCMINNSSSLKRNLVKSKNQINDKQYYIRNFVKVIEIDSTKIFSGLISSDTDELNLPLRM